MIYLEFEDGEILDLDCVDSINPTYSVQKTTHEIEDGSEVTDNINVSPDAVEVSGMISNVGLNKTGGFDPEEEGPHTVFFDRVRTAVKAGETCDLVAGVFGVYQNMKIINFAPSFEVDTGSACNYSISLEEFKLVNAQVEVNKPDPGKRPAGRTDADRLAPETKSGDATPKEATETQGVALTAALRF